MLRLDTYMKANLFQRFSHEAADLRCVFWHMGGGTQQKIARYMRSIKQGTGLIWIIGDGRDIAGCHAEMCWPNNGGRHSSLPAKYIAHQRFLIHGKISRKPRPWRHKGPGITVQIIHDGKRTHR